MSLPHSTRNEIRAREREETRLLIVARTRALAGLVALGMTAFAYLDWATTPAPMALQYWLMAMASVPS